MTMIKVIDVAQNPLKLLEGAGKGVTMSEEAAQRIRQGLAKEGQVVKYLHERIQFELPPALLKSETRRILADLVQRNRERGVPDEMLKDKEKELVETAAGLAAHRLKTNFILHRIAERENVKVSRDDINARLREEAARYNVPMEKMRKELQEHDGLDAFAEQILLGKTLDFLKANVSVEAAQEPAVKEEKS
jgi:trigger factor